MPLDPPEPPNNLQSQSSGSKLNRRLTVVGVVLWILGGGLIGALLFTDTGGTNVESVFRITLGVAGTAIVALFVGAIMYQILKRLNLVGSLLTNIFWGVLLSLLLPVVGWFAVQELGIVTGAIRTEIINALPINEGAMEGLAEAREALTGGE